MFRFSILPLFCVLYLGSASSAQAVVASSCNGLFSGALGLLGQPKAIRSSEIHAQRLSDEELRDEYARTSILDFVEVPTSLFSRVVREDRAEVKDFHWVRMLDRIEEGYWEKVMLRLKSGQELHYYECVDCGLVAFPKWK